MTPPLKIAGLRKSYGAVVALAGVDLTIPAGEVCALLGPNGAGKSTLVSAVAGLLRPDAGTVRICGVDVAAAPQTARRMLGLAGQDLAIYPTVSVRDNLRLFGELAGLRRRPLEDRIADVARLLDLTALLGRPAGRLSGGEKRRLHTAVALLHRPPLLLLDEPTAGVDVTTRARMLAGIRELVAEEGCAVCYSTHYLGEVEELGASVAVLDHGRVIARGPLDELIRRHSRSAVELVFDTAPPLAELDVVGLDVEVTGTTVRVFGDRPAALAGRVLAGLDAQRTGLRGIEFVTPSLEAVFLALTGRRFDGPDGTGDTGGRAGPGTGPEGAEAAQVAAEPVAVGGPGREGSA